MYVNCQFLKKSKRTKRFIVWPIAFIVLPIIILASSTIAIAALMELVKTAYEVSSVMTNFTEELQMQTVIDQQILARLDALETLLWVGEKQDALNT